VVSRGEGEVEDALAIDVPSRPLTALKAILALLEDGAALILLRHE